MSNKVVIGTCSLCGGAVCVHRVWNSTEPDVPTCSTCGARPKQAYGPVIEMEQRLGPQQVGLPDPQMKVTCNRIVWDPRQTHEWIRLTQNLFGGSSYMKDRTRPGPGY